MTKEEIDGICEIWILVPNTRPGLGIPARIMLAPDQVADVKAKLHDYEEMKKRAMSVEHWEAGSENSPGMDREE